MSIMTIVSRYGDIVILLMVTYAAARYVCRLMPTIHRGVDGAETAIGRVRDAMAARKGISRRGECLCGSINATAMNLAI